MWTIDFDRNICVDCGECVKVCSRRALTMGENGPMAVEDAAERCFHCQHCMCVCPTGAVTVEGVGAKDCPADGRRAKDDELLNLIRMRRSCRIFKAENLEKDTLDKLVGMLPYSPTGVNSRTLKFSVVDDVKKMDEIRRLSAEKLLNAFEMPEIPAGAVKFLAMKNALQKGINPIFRNAPHLLAVSCPDETPCRTIDPIIALSYFELYANSMNVGTLWCGLAKWLIDDYMPELLNMLDIPAGYSLGYIMLFGPADVEYKRAPVRTMPPECIARIH